MLCFRYVRKTPLFFGFNVCYFKVKRHRLIKALAITTTKLDRFSGSLTSVLIKSTYRKLYKHYSFVCPRQKLPSFRGAFSLSKLKFGGKRHVSLCDVLSFAGESRIQTNCRDTNTNDAVPVFPLANLNHTQLLLKNSDWP